jgi:transposase
VVYSASKYLMADETAITVLDTEKIKGRKAHTGYMWSYSNPVDRLVFFEYQKGRANKHARPVLEHFRGTLHTDGYGVYKHYGNREGVIHVKCNAHARRKFDEAKFTDKARAEHVLEAYRKLYAIEKYCSENSLSFDERKAIRQQNRHRSLRSLLPGSKRSLPKSPPYGAR